MIINMTSGTPLNFKVKAYASESLLPATAAENTIAVITDTAITSWIIDTNEPAAPEEGMVWIAEGAQSDVEFNALKTNTIKVYPILVKQYIGGAWANKSAKSYQNGEWVSWWSGELYDAGNEYKNITGGWKSVVSGGSAIIGSNTLTVSASANDQNASITTANMIDLSWFDKLRVNVTDWASGDNSNNRCQIRILDSSKNVISLTNVYKIDVYSVDVSSLTGGYIQLFAYSTESYTHKMTASRLWLE